MNQDQAHAYRTARSNEYRHLRRKTKHELVAIYQSEGGYIGAASWSKEEIAGALLERRYPLAIENEAIHILYHTEVAWDGCGFCQDEPAKDTREPWSPFGEALQVGIAHARERYQPTGTGWPEDGEAQRIAEVFDEARAELDRGI